MKRILIGLVLVLAACVPVSTATQRDLFIDAQSARGTADSAERFLTATAEAPIIHITETAAGLIVVGTQNAMNLTSTAVQWTPTASPVPTITLTPTPNATGTLGAIQLAAQSTQIANDLEIKGSQKALWKIAPALSFAVFILVLAIVLMFQSRRERYRPMQVDERGNLLPLIDVVDGKVTDVDRNPNYQGDLGKTIFEQWLRKKLDLPPLLPPITPERQDATTTRDQLSDMAIRGLPGGPKAERKQLAAGLETMTPHLESRFRLMDDTTNLDVIDAEIIQVLDHDWKETEQK